MLYGRPTKHVRHVNETTYTIGPQRFQLHTFWKYGSNATARTDGQDLDNETKCPLGSRITKHKMEMLVTPETIEPQQLYIARLKLSFQDCYNASHCGGHFVQASYGDTATENFQVISNAIATEIYPDDANTNIIQANVQTPSTDKEIGGSGSGYGIKELMLDDNIRHVMNPKKVTVFDQRPLMGERWQRIPSKVKRINEGTWYGLWIFNDSVRGATPADTQVTVNIKDYVEEMAI